jgi:hypothetical protein
MMEMQFYCNYKERGCFDKFLCYEFQKIVLNFVSLWTYVDILILSITKLFLFARPLYKLVQCYFTY